MAAGRRGGEAALSSRWAAAPVGRSAPLRYASTGIADEI